ncbi:MAG: glucose-6-phosphate isomerase [Verrucomicrobiales bacterium]
MSHWSRFQNTFLRDTDTGLTLDVSRMSFPDGFFERMGPLCEKALADMAELEDGAIANPDEGRMVGHYWLRTPSLAPTPELRAEIERDIEASLAFAADIHAGRIAPPGGGKFTRILIIGIGGSALGPQLAAAALVDDWHAPVRTHFFDNTDPDGFARVLAGIGDDLRHTLSIVISKSGGTPETRNGMLAAESAYAAAGLKMAQHAVAVTGTAAGGLTSKLEAHATQHGWLKIFPMTDWVGGRTSVMSTVGLVPLALQGANVRAFLAGASAVDAKTRSAPARQNMALLLALAWHHAGGGKGAKDMVILPYKDRLSLMSKYLQQLVMESLGKQHDLHGTAVNQGIAVYGNKGSTDQHAYVQQLRDGVNNFFATFIEVREASAQPELEVEPGVTPGDYLQGFLRGTRAALFDNGRASVTLSIPRVDAYYLGALIALYERAVGFYASLVNINAYHQPGVEAGKKAAGVFLALLGKVRAALTPTPPPADQIAATLGADPEDVWHCLTHLTANRPDITATTGPGPADDRFNRSGAALSGTSR